MEAAQMAINRGVGKEDAVHAYSGILLGRQKHEIRPFAATGVDLEIIILNQTGKGKYHSYVESKIRCK